MKFIHLGDLHIGKIIHEYSMLEDQKYALDNLIEIIKEEKPNALIIAGDLYDRSIPPADAVEVLSEFFTRVVSETNTKILSIAGNHDSKERISYLNKVLENQGIFIEGSYNGNVKKITLEEKGDCVDFYLLPYTEPSEVRKIRKNASIKSHEDALLEIINNIEIENKSVFIAHAYVGKTSIESSDSERPLSIGNAEIVDPCIFERFTYTALGHLHSPQNPIKNVRYSGSLLKYSVSEEKQKKSISIVKIDKGGEVTINQRSLKIKRDLRTVTGYIDDILLLKDEKIDDYVFFYLLDEGELIDPIGRLRSVYKNVLGLKKVSREKENVDIMGAKEYKKKGMDELFLDFYLEFSEEIAPDRKEKIGKLIESVTGEVTK